jgi:hypothetical protein
MKTFVQILWLLFGGRTAFAFCLIFLWKKNIARIEQLYLNRRIMTPLPD